MEQIPNHLIVVKHSPVIRPEDRFLQTFVLPVPFRAERVLVVATVEIHNRWHHALEVGNSLPETFARFFTKSTHQSVLTRFEDALKSINITIESAAKKLETKINCALAVHTGNQVYFSTIGDAKIVLLRKNHVTTVAGAGKDASKEEFSTVTSGELVANDWLGYTNTNLEKALKDEELTIESPASLIKLLQTYGMEDAIAGSFVQYDNTQAGRLLTTHTEPKQLPVKLPTFTTPKIPWATIGASLVAIVAGIKNRLPKKSAASEHESAPVEPVVEVSPEATDFPAAVTPPTVKRRLVIKLSPVGAIGALILLVLAGASIYQIRNVIKARRTPAPVATAPTATLISDLQTADTTKAQTILATQLTTGRYNALSASDQATAATLASQFGITISQLPSPLFSLPTTGAVISSTAKGDVIVAIDQTGQLSSWNGKTLTKATQVTTISSPISMAVFASNKIVVSDAQGNMYLFDGSDKQPLKLDQPTSWTTGKRYVASYNGNLYVLTISDGIVHKVPGFGNSIGNDSVLVSGVLSSADQLAAFVIPGDVMTLSSLAGLVDHPKGGQSTTLIAPNSASPASSVSFTTKNIFQTAGHLVGTYSSTGQWQSGVAYVSDEPINQIITAGTHQLILINANIYQVN